MTEILNSPINTEELLRTGVDVELETFVVGFIADDTVSTYTRVSEIINQLNNYHNETKDINDFIAPPRLIIRDEGITIAEDITMFIAEELGWTVDNMRLEGQEEIFQQVINECDTLLCITGNNDSELANIARENRGTHSNIRLEIV